MKRLLQICFNQNPPFVCGSLMLISELLKTKKNLFQLDHSVLSRNNLLPNGTSDLSKFGEVDDEEEKFVDAKVDSENEDNEEESEANEEKNETNGKASTSWVHKKNIIFKRHDKYDYHERNPLYAGADKTLTYELLLFTRHYHPTVVVFANKLMNVS